MSFVTAPQMRTHTQYTHAVVVNLNLEIGILYKKSCDWALSKTVCNSFLDLTPSNDYLKYFWKEKVVVVVEGCALLNTSVSTIRCDEKVGFVVVERGIDCSLC